ncbi:MAG: PDZ domain-containing protein [Deltaproteobacteria bacterium]
MKKIFLALILSTSLLVSGCLPMMFVAISAEQGAQSQRIFESQAATVKTQRGVFFENYMEYPGEIGTAPIMHIKVKSIAPKSEAEKAGIKAGDEVIMVNDKIVCEYYDRSVIIQPFFSGEDKPIKFTMRRDNYEYIATLNPL